MSLEITESSERKSRMSGVIWGMAKCGKTTFLTSLPGKKLFVMLDPDGDMSIPNREDIFILRLYEQPDDVILRYLRDKLPAILRKNEGNFESVIVDSLSTLGLILLNEAIRTEVGGSKSFKPTIDAPGLAAYGSRTNNLVDIVNKILRATGSVGAHCWFTSHEDEAKTDDKGNMLGISMTLSGKATNGIGLNVSEIWHLSSHDKKWRLMIAPGRGRSPMGSRIFNVTKVIEFQLKFDPDAGLDQSHSLAKWYNDWIENGRHKLEVPI
jgi:hypothetical protein